MDIYDEGICKTELGWAGPGRTELLAVGVESHHFS